MQGISFPKMAFDMEQELDALMIVRSVMLLLVMNNELEQRYDDLALEKPNQKKLER